MAATITGLKQIEANMRKMQKELEKKAKKAIRTSLNAGAKEAKRIMKPHIPVLGSSTNFRQKGTVKNNLRHTTKVSKNELKGITIIRIKRAGKKRMARVGENTRDRTDPFYWFMVDQGTSKMRGRHFMQKGANAAKAKALKVVAQTFEAEMKK
ncbi:hypothetical protein A4G19_15520 [Pasteurellaceae bacterium Macca]|nr:hypothetical protein [Pasteurellaceae bacterium Macca]MCK3657069.1 hypothetical protein [Pasteurellaceae bacterium Macca]